MCGFTAPERPRLLAAVPEYLSTWARRVQHLIYGLFPGRMSVLASPSQGRLLVPFDLDALLGEASLLM